jgi:hypothetical protein
MPRIEYYMAERNVRASAYRYRDLKPSTKGVTR